MEVALALASASVSSLSLHPCPPSPSVSLRPHRMWIPPFRPSPAGLLHICSALQEQDPYVTYDEKKSVFPAEACEEVGGESCEIDGVGPEVKAKRSPPKEPTKSPLGGKDREYVEYTEAKTVFPGEACDELGGEFCEPEYQSGVFPEKAAAK